MAQKKDAPPPEKPSRGLAARAPARAARKTGPKTGPKTGTRASPKPPAPGSVGSPRGRSGPRAGLGKAGLGKAAPEAGLLMIGCGKMGQALLDRWLVAGRIQAKFPATIVDPQRFSALAAPRKAVRAFAALEDIPAQRKFDTVLLAVKPSDYEKTCLELRAWLVERHARSKATPPSLLISVMAGIGTSLLQAVFEAPVSLPDAASGSAGAPDQSSSPGLSPGLSSGLSPSFFTGLSIVRAMPNLPVAIGHGLTFLCPSGRCRKGALRRATTLFKATGQTILLEQENAMNAATAISGSGPAYICLFIESLVEASCYLGLPEDMASQVVPQILEGALRLLAASGQTPRQLRQAVTSPEGATEAALAVLMDERHGMPALVRRAVILARDRGRELGIRH